MEGNACEEVFHGILPPFVASICLLALEQLLAASKCKSNSISQLISTTTKHYLSREEPGKEADIDVLANV